MRDLSLALVGRILRLTEDFRLHAQGKCNDATALHRELGHRKQLGLQRERPEAIEDLADSLSADLAQTPPRACAKPKPISPTSNAE